MSLNSEPVKYALIALSAPLWLPFARALWNELNASLRDEGGLFGRTPTKAELERLERQLGRHESTLINETWDEHLAGRGPSPRPEAAARATGVVRRHGFR